MFEGSRGYHCEAGVSRPLQRLPQSEQLAFSFSGKRRILLSPGEKEAMSLGLLVASSVCAHP